MKRYLVALDAGYDKRTRNDFRFVGKALYLYGTAGSVSEFSSKRLGGTGRRRDLL